MILFQAAVPFLAGVLLAAFGGAGAWPIGALGGGGNLHRRTAHGKAQGSGDVGSLRVALPRRYRSLRRGGAALQEADGRVLIVTRPFPEYEYGDVLEVMATLETPPRLDAFDYREYLARQGVHSQILFPE